MSARVVELPSAADVEYAEARGIADEPKFDAVETAKRIDTSKRNVYALWNRGELGFLQIGRLRRTPLSEIERFLRASFRPARGGDQ